MLTPRRTRRLPTFLLGCLTAALLTTQAVAAIPVIIDYTDGQTDATPYDTSAPNDPTGLSILSGTATQSGIITGSGGVIKLGAGTLILSGANDYTGTTTLNAGTLEVVVGGIISNLSNLTIGDQDGDVATLLMTGGNVTSNQMYLGLNAGSSGTVSVSGGISFNNILTVGHSGTGVLNLSGGSFNDSQGSLGFNAGSSGTANVSDGVWNNFDDLFVGNSGTGLLNLTGGFAKDRSGYLGFTADSSGTANVSGGVWNNNLDLFVGNAGTGVLNLSGGTVNNDFGYIGHDAGSSGTANVSGGTWYNGSALFVGNSGTGVLNLTGGTVSDNSGFLGYLSGSSGTANVSGGTWTNNVELYIGNYGTGVLNLSGGNIINSLGVLGLQSDSSGTANVSGGTWTNNGDLYVGNSGTGVLNLTGGEVLNTFSYLGWDIGSSGTANVSGGTWTNTYDLSIGNNGAGVLNLSGGSVTNYYSALGYFSGSSGTANVSGGTWTNNGPLVIGRAGTGVLNLTGGTVSNGYGTLGDLAGSSGTANVSGGDWNTSNVFLTVGKDGTGILNLTDSGTVSVGSGTGTLILANNAGSGGLLRIGTGGAAGTLNAASIYGGSGTAAVIFNHTGSLNFTTTLDGSLTAYQLGTGTTILSAQHTYTGATGVLGGTLELRFGGTTADIISSDSYLFMGSGTLLLTGEGRQTLNGLYTADFGAGSIVLGQNQDLNLGNLAVVSDYSALNFNTAAAGADGEDLGSSSIALNYPGSHSPLRSGFTVTDSTGFGLAALNDSGFIIRLTSTDLLPASGADAATDYRIDNNSGDSTTSGSSTLIVTDSQSAQSITVDTTAAPGVLTLAENAVLNTRVWNFGSAPGSSHAFEITGGPNSGITTDIPNGLVQINNYNAAPVTISTSILETNTTGLQVGGPGTTILTATSSYTGDTIVTSGVLEVATNGTVNNDPGSTFVGYQQGDHATLLISGGSVTNGSGFLGFGSDSSGILTVTSGDWTNTRDLNAGYFGTGVLNIAGGSVSNANAYLGTFAGSSGTANVSSGTWTNNFDLILGYFGTSVLNLSGGSVTNFNVTLGSQSGSSGTANVSGGTWTSNGELKVGDSGTGVLNLTGGDISNTTDFLGYASGSSGTANVSGGTWSNYLGFDIGHSGTGVLNLSGGSIINYNFDSILGNNAGSSGTANVSGGYWRSPKLVIGNEGTGVINISGGDVGSNVVLGNLAGSSGTANVSGGLWRSNDFTIGSYGTGVVNLTGGGISAENGPLYMATHAGSSGTLNLGTGGAMGSVGTNSIIGGAGTAVVNFNHTDNAYFGAKLEGSMTVNFIGSGTSLLWGQSTYTGPTNLLGGTLGLGYFVFGSDHVLSTTTDLTLGSATLSILSSVSSNTVHSLSTRADSAGSIILKGENQTLDLGSLASVGSRSALNINTAAGGADGDTVGSSFVLLAGQTAGSAINPGFTVTDATGFGLATVNGLNQIIRLTTSDLLPASDAVAGSDYRIDNNAGDATTPGSAVLTVTASQSARSITVDTTAHHGTLTLGSAVVLSSDVWNFGGANGEPYGIQGSDSSAGITSATAGGTLQINNNYNSSFVDFSLAILDNGGTNVLVQGPGLTFFSGENSYTGNTTVTSGFLAVMNGSISSFGITTIGSQAGDNATLYIYGTQVNDGGGVIGDAAGAHGIVNITGSLENDSGRWSNSENLTVGRSGTGVLNISMGGASSQNGYLGVNAGSSGTVTLARQAFWNIRNSLTIGQNGTGVVNVEDDSYLSLDHGRGSITLGAQGTLNIGTGGASGALEALTVTGASGAVLNYNFNAYSFMPGRISKPVLAGALTVNKLGGGLLTFDTQNTYTGRTTVNGGTLDLLFTTFTSGLISSSSALTLGGGTLNLTTRNRHSNSQTLNGLTTTAGTGSQITLSPTVVLDLGALTSAGSGSALNFDLNQGGANGASVGTGIVLLSGQTAGSVINPGFTVTDSTGFGLATVNDLNQVIRLTSTDLLPDSSAVAGTDYLIDNNNGDSLTPGSSTLEVTASQTARSITVDTTTSSGLLTLASGIVLRSDVWNFGSSTGFDYEITGSGSGAGISTATAGGMLQINNYNDDVVTISAPILDNGGSSLRVAGTSDTFLTGADTYTGKTIVNSGYLFINGDHRSATGEIIVQSGARLGGVGTVGSNIQVENGGLLRPGGFKGDGMLTGTTATFATNSIFQVSGSDDTLSTLHLTGAVTITPGALLKIDAYDQLTAGKYTLMTADGGGLDGSTQFTLLNGYTSTEPVPGYHLFYTGNTLDLVSDVTAPAAAYWTGAQSSFWTDSNWATAADGLTDTGAPPSTPTDVTFSSTGVGLQQTNLNADFTVKSLTVNSDTTIYSAGAQTLTVNNATSVNALLAIDTGVTLAGKDDLTISTTGTLTGSSIVQMDADKSIIVQGALSVGAPGAVIAGYQTLYLTTSGTGSIVMDPGSVIIINLLTGAGFGTSSLLPAGADQLSIHGKLDATSGSTLVLANPNAMTGYVGGDHWKVIELNAADPSPGTITGHLGLNDSGLGLATGFVGTFDQTTGIYSIADHRPEMTTQSSGLPMANAESQSIISGSQTANNDINNHLFNLRSGGGEEDSDDSIGALMDYGVVVGEGDGPEDKNPIAKKVLRTRQWEVFTTVNYGNVKLNPISSQSGVQIDSWASSVGIERHLSRSVTVGFAATFLQSTQTYTGGLGKLDLEGPTLSAYLAYVRKGFWGSLLYSFGDYDLGSQRNPGLGLPTASGSTRSYTNSVQFNTGYNFRFQDNTFVTGPFVGIDYLHGTVDAYSETGGGLGALAYGKQTFESLVTRVGWSAAKKIQTTWAAITPQVRLSYERQNLKNNGTSVSLINAPCSATGGNQSPGQDYVVFGTGVNFQFTPDFSMLLGYQAQLFRNNMEAHFGSVRFGYKF
ncbi:MAG: autotransporter-associated beta strand repeat-containing protein [Verrucomicrobia bacterium]|nr:autotransporter-associated beta strand repeat-containing protein [Verrucomicrobiota bacterium]